MNFTFKIAQFVERNPYEVFNKLGCYRYSLSHFIDANVLRFSEVELQRLLALFPVLWELHLLVKVFIFLSSIFPQLNSFLLDD